MSQDLNLSREESIKNYGSTYSQALKKMRKILKYLSEQTPHKPFIKDEIACSDVRIGHINGKPVKRLVLHFRSNGCGWKKTGGCTMCGFWNETSQMKEKITEGDFLNQFKSVMDKFDLDQFPIISPYNAGSLLNEKEIPFSALEKIFNFISKIDGIEQVILESRIEYIDFEKVRHLKNLLKGKELIVCSGFESSNDIIRELCVHKGIKKNKFEKYIEKAHSYGVKSGIYVLIKPPFITECEAIEDAVNTTKYLFDLGVKDIHYETMTIEEHTLVSALFNKGYYELPWLWSIMEIINKLHPKIKPYVSPFRYITSSEKVPNNCDNCSDKVSKAILEDYCTSFDISNFRKLNCPCKSQWSEKIGEKNSKPIENRVLDVVSELSAELGIC